MSNSDFRSLAKEVQEEVNERIDLSKEILDEDIQNIITGIVFDKSRGRYLSLTQKRKLISFVFNSMRRLDIIQPLLEDKSVTEIMVNGPEYIFVEKNGYIKQLDLQFENPEKLENIIQSIVSKVNRAVNEASPIVDARLQDGSRVNVVLPPIALGGPTMTIRKFPDKPLTVEKLVEIGSLTKDAAVLLQKLVKAKYNMFISGGTGSGKTTFLNALSNFIPPNERIITIEDSAELQIQNINNLVRLEKRNANTEGKGEIAIRELIKTSLRMRPDRIVVGEVRGPEALDMLQAMNTGHEGSLSTGHANTTTDMFSRLETMVLSATLLPIEVIRKQIASALDIIIHLGRLRDGSRRVLEISEVAGYAEGDIVLNTLFRFEEEGELDNKVVGSLKNAGSLMHILKLKMAGINIDD
ncbi:MAG: pilus assembly protein [Firmicutes bacterium HGW-Firmicutes-8]|nr:MAG: pilus assembly protein [Firmicutes bacterium HGW-Firmicutes-8]